ncbi:MAG TPA: hypothetical protein ENJ95_08275, partial [Bacteroidetes bacterium]|nr:hypothetical protein [Bacteroidota bacterium]
MKIEIHSIPKIIACQLICLLSLLIQLNAQPGSQYWNSESSLSNDWISQIEQDRDGYIWIATQYGLNRFDGYEFKNYQYEANNPKSLSANWVRNMAQDSAGIFWLGLYLGGINSFDPKTGTATRYNVVNDAGQELRVRTVFCDRAQSVWAGGFPGLFVKRAGQARFEFVENISVSDIKEDHAGHIIILSNNTIYRFDPKNVVFEKTVEFKGEYIRRIYVDKNNVLWAYGTGHLYKIFRQNGQWEKEEIIIGNYAHSGSFFDSPIYEFSKNEFWIGGGKGISILNRNGELIKTIDYADIFPKGKPIGKALSFFEDKSGNKWIGTSKGLILQSPFSERFEIKNIIPHLDEFSNVREILQIENTLWVSNPRGLFRIQIDRPDLPPEQILTQTSFSLLKSSDGYLYAGG